jgi:hypothetical protein
MPSNFKEYTAKLAASVKKISNDDLVKIFNIDIVRPYTNISAIVTALKVTNTQATEYERLARYIIDSHTGGFEYMRKKKEFIGDNSDQLLIDEPITGKIYSILENNEVMFERDNDLNNNDQEFVYKRQLSAIVQNLPNGNNRVNYTRVWRDRYLDLEFYNGYEYLVDADFGWKVIPQDIQDAADMLIQDIATDSLKYVNRYIESFDNDDFKIKFAKNWTASTGNRVVDRILEKYQRPIRVGMF